MRTSGAAAGRVAQKLHVEGSTLWPRHLAKKRRPQPRTAFLPLLVQYLLFFWLEELWSPIAPPAPPRPLLGMAGDCSPGTLLPELGLLLGPEPLVSPVLPPVTPDSGAASPLLCEVFATCRAFPP